ncbi:unnamed protein product, partial [Schistosoma curassoni]|uniref:Integrase_H2C2 domain-containing protein n=1 Tax=Schistosoma curassoni TaxID=6186 RepID=A0A183L3H4_9TREM
MTYESTSVVDVPPRKDWVTMMSRALDLPKKEIIRFDGNPMNYWSFIRNFQDCFDESIGFRSRLNYLIQYCDGEAKNTIVHCALLEPEEGYRKALELLEEAFGQKHIVAHAFIDKMLNIPAIKGTDPYNLRRLSREMHICELTLTQMNYVSDLNSTKTIECMFLKLPLHLQREWVKVACRILKTGREPSFKDLCEFVKEQSDIANTRYGLLVNRGTKEELEDKFGQLYSTEFKDPFSRTISMSVEDRIALSAISHSVQRLNGHYQIALPWRHNHKLPNYRRNVLSHVASIFDPIGFVAPIILPAKVILQDTCRQKLDWDAELPVDCQTKWNNWCRHIKGLDHLRIPRCLKPGFEPSSAQIHCFPDASELAYGVVAYIRYKSVFGQIHCSFLLAKSRVAPLKLVTIPRMELTACVLCAKIGRHVREQLSIPISSVIYWTDSTVVLHCIKNTTKGFVSSRLETIHELSTPSQSRYVKGKLNPADHASRGLSLNDKVKVREWLQGPRLLWEEENKWPNLEKIENTIAHVLTEDFGLPRHDDEFLGKIRVGGRLQLSCLPFETKYPIILPNNHFVTDMIIMRYHVINAHVGVTQTLSSIREEYWIVRGYSTVRKVLKRCYL